MSPSESSLIFRARYPALNRTALRRYADDLCRRLGSGRSFQVLITGDAELKALNHRFRRRNASTDVLSFPSSSQQELGDVAISYDHAKAQARSFGHSTEMEIRILMLHGVLHLIGMDHESDGGEMARAERRWRRAFGLPNNLIARTWP